MNESECLSKMVAPGQIRPGKYRGGVIQIWVTRACDKQCFGCTQGSNLGGNPGMITPEQFEQAVISLKGYWGVVGVFGGNPAMHPKFELLCDIIAKHIPYEQCGLWCNNPINESKAKAMRRTFNPAVSNLNVHLDREAFQLFKTYWPDSRPFGLQHDSRHSPCYVAMKDVLLISCDTCNGTGISGRVGGGPCLICNGRKEVYDISHAYELISKCDINQHWSAIVGVFRNELRAWFCEIAGAQAMLHQHEPYYPDTGLDPTQLYMNAPRNEVYVDTPKVKWWELGMWAFTGQVQKHCHECSVPLRGYGELAQAKPIQCPKCLGEGEGKWDHDTGCELPVIKCDNCNGEGSISPREQVSATHQAIFKPKDKSRRVELVTVPSQLEQGRIEKTTHYLQNAEK